MEVMCNLVFNLTGVERMNPKSGISGYFTLEGAKIQAEKDQTSTGMKMYIVRCPITGLFFVVEDSIEVKAYKEVWGIDE